MTLLDVINAALLKVGLPLAATLEDCDWNARFVFDNVVNRLLRGYAWGFAQKLAVLNPMPNDPCFAYKYRYQLPDDNLRVVDVHNCQNLRSPKATYMMEGKFLLTNVSPLLSALYLELSGPLPVAAGFP